METPVYEVQRSPKPQSATELIKEIATLEMEVVHLEKYLLSLYRKAFDHRLESLPKDSKKINHTKVIPKKNNCTQTPQDDAIDDAPPGGYYEAQEKQLILDSSVQRSQSSLSHSAYTIQSPPLFGKAAEAVYSFHSMPLTQCATGEGLENVISLGDHLSEHNFSQLITETANRISEEMLRCISGIYCELAATSTIKHDYASPAVLSFTSSTSGSPLAESALWSPPYRINPSLDFHSDASFYAGGYGEFSGPYCPMVEVLQIDRDSPKMREIEPMLQKYRSLVKKLEGVNPSRLKHEEKLAFWINLHNALVMHAFLVYGVPQIKLKRVSLLLKVSYNVGGQTVSVGMIQNHILGRQLPHTEQWFHRLFHPRKRFRTGEERKLFLIDRPEPLSYFALCCGCHSDPPVRIYTPRTVFQDLIASRGEYLLSNYRVQKEQNKIMLPKIVDNYAKDSGLHPADFWGIIEQILPADILTNKTSRYHQHRKVQKKGIGWIPHDFSFRYQFLKELFDQHMSS